MFECFHSCFCCWFSLVAIYCLEEKLLLLPPLLPLRLITIYPPGNSRKPQFLCLAMHHHNLQSFLCYWFAANGDQNMSRSVPSSPGDRKFQQQPPIPVAGSAENLVGRVNKFRLLFKDPSVLNLHIWGLFKMRPTFFVPRFWESKDWANTVTRSSWGQLLVRCKRPWTWHLRNLTRLLISFSWPSGMELFVYPSVEVQVWEKMWVQMESQGAWLCYQACPVGSGTKDGQLWARQGKWPQGIVGRNSLDPRSHRHPPRISAEDPHLWAQPAPHPLGARWPRCRVEAYLGLGLPARVPGVGTAGLWWAMWQLPWPLLAGGNGSTRAVEKDPVKSPLGKSYYFSPMPSRPHVDVPLKTLQVMLKDRFFHVPECSSPGCPSCPPFPVPGCPHLVLVGLCSNYVCGWAGEEWKGVLWLPVRKRPICRDSPQHVLCFLLVCLFIDARFFLENMRKI